MYKKQMQIIKPILLMLAIATGSSLVYFLRESKSAAAYASVEAPYNRYIFNNDERDIQDVERLFADAQDRYLLTVRPVYDVRKMMSNRMSEYDDPSTLGDLTIMIARDKQTGEFIGFTAHHKVSFYKSKLLFLALNPQVRGKGYGKAMVKQAVDDMRREGALKVILDVREENKRARTLYESIGFKEVSTSRGFVRYQLDVAHL